MLRCNIACNCDDIKTKVIINAQISINWTLELSSVSKILAFLAKNLPSLDYAEKKILDFYIAPQQSKPI